MKKRISALFLSLALCLGLALPASAYDMGKAGENNIVSAGMEYTGFIDQNGALWMWGYNYFGQLGNGTTKDSSTPVKVLDNVAAVSCGWWHTAAVKTDGSLWSWGSNHLGQLGNGSTTDCTTPVKLLDNVAAVSGGYGHTAAVRTDGSLWTWGDNQCGQLGYEGGNSTPTYSGEPIQTVPVKVLDNVAAVSCGMEHTAAIRTDGSLWMWGNNRDGQLGNGGGGNVVDYPIQTVPVKVLDNVAAVSCGRYHTAAIRTDGSLWMWGYNRYGQLGNGGGGNATDRNGDPIQTVPVKVLDNVAAVSCGWWHSAAVKTDGSLWMWGYNRYGQLGNGGGVNATDKYGNPIQTVPVKVLDSVAAVCCGYLHTAAVRTDGSLWMWGNNSDGQLGYEGGNTHSGEPIQTVPKQVTGLNAFWSVKLNLNGGTGTGTLWTNASGTIQVPTNPTREGYTFGGWYTDEALTRPWNFNDKVVNTLTLYAKWTPVSSTATTTGKSSQSVSLNGNKVTIDAYNLIAGNGGEVTYVKLRDVAALLENTSARFNVDWRSGAIYVSSNSAYTTKNGTELKPITGTDGSYKWNTAPVLFDGETKALEGIVITDGNGGGHTFFKLRDLGDALGFTVGWSAEKGIYIETK